MRSNSTFDWVGGEREEVFDRMFAAAKNREQPLEFRIQDTEFSPDSVLVFTHS